MIMQAHRQSIKRKKQTQSQAAFSQVIQRKTQIRLCFPSFGVLYQFLKHFAFKVHLILAADMNSNYGESTQCS